MDLRQLRYFTQIVESGSLVKASRELFIAQPALSQQLAKLEAEVGKALLVRGSRGVTPTSNGLALYHHARFLLLQLDQALAISRQESGIVSGTVTLGLPATTVSPLGLPLMRNVRSRYPGIRLNIIEGLSGQLAQMMRHGHLELAVLFDRAAVPDMVATELLDEELFLVLPRQSRLVAARRTRMTLAEIAQLPLVMPTESHGLRRRVTAEFDRQGLQHQVVVEVDSLPLLMDCVHDGMGVTIKPISALDVESGHGRQWRAITISDVHISRRNYLFSMGPHMLSPAAAAVAGELRDTTRHLVTTGQWQGVRLVE